MRRLGFAFAAVLLVGACGAVSGQGDLPRPTPPTAALGAWKDFPASASPRPIIAFGDAVEHIQPQGFPNGDRKIAWMCNRFVLDTNLTLSAGAAAAYRKLMSERMANAGTDSACPTLPPFVITAARLATAGFPTDRGTAQLPAWLFDVPEVNAYIGYLAIDGSRLWTGGIVTKHGRGARVSADGTTLRVAVANQQPGPCGSDYASAVAESSTAVAVALKQISHSSPGANVICPLSLVMGFITIKLNSPLGGRVLVDENGDVGSVCPEDRDC